MNSMSMNVSIVYKCFYCLVMISRTLGPEFGGSIGTLFFFANIVGSALAITGCAEGIVQNLGPGGFFTDEHGIIPSGGWWPFLYCTLVNTIMLIVSLVGASLFSKTNVLILAAVVVCLLSTFISFFIQDRFEVCCDINVIIPIFHNYSVKSTGTCSK